MSTVLTVPTPTLTFDDAGGGAAALEKPVNVLLGAVTEAGTPVTPVVIATAGFRVSRRVAAGATAEVWDDGAKAWLPDGPSTQAKPVALIYKDGDPNPWQGLFVAAGMKDGTGTPAFAKAVNGYPSYTISGAFAGRDGAAGASAPSAALTFVSAADSNLVVLGPGDGEQPDRATHARVVLKDAGKNVIGQLLVTRNSPGAEVRIENAAGASVVLNADGSIDLNPASGRTVRVNGDFEASRIFYSPGGQPTQAAI